MVAVAENPTLKHGVVPSREAGGNAARLIKDVKQVKAMISEAATTSVSAKVSNNSKISTVLQGGERGVQTKKCAIPERRIP